MVDVAIRVIDRMIQLLKYRETERKAHFKELIEPLYNDAEIIVNDYLEMCGIILSKLNSKTPLEDIILWLEQRRTIHLALRIKIRAFMDKTRPSKFLEYNMGQLERGILSILYGGHTLLEEERNVIQSMYQPEHHTILSAMLYFSTKPDDRTEDEYYEICTQFTKRMQEHLSSAWADTSAAFAEMKQQTR